MGIFCIFPQIVLFFSQYMQNFPMIFSQCKFIILTLHTVYNVMFAPYPLTWVDTGSREGACFTRRKPNLTPHWVNAIVKYSTLPNLNCKTFSPPNRSTLLIDWLDILFYVCIVYNTLYMAISKQCRWYISLWPSRGKQSISRKIPSLTVTSVHSPIHLIHNADSPTSNF